MKPQQALPYLLLLLRFSSSLPLTPNEVETRVVAVKDASPSLLSTAVSQAEPSLLRAALTYASPSLLRVALTRAVPKLLAAALQGVDDDLLVVALTEAEPEHLETALTVADPTILKLALTHATHGNLAVALQDATLENLEVALTSNDGSSNSYTAKINENYSPVYSNLVTNEEELEASTSKNEDEDLDSLNLINLLQSLSGNDEKIKVLNGVEYDQIIELYDNNNFLLDYLNEDDEEKPVNIEAENYKIPQNYNLKSIQAMLETTEEEDSSEDEDSSKDSMEEIVPIPVDWYYRYYNLPSPIWIQHLVPVYALNKH